MGGLRMIVGGFLGLLPAGGVAWDYVQYPAGLAALGDDAYYVENIGAADCRMPGCGVDWRPTRQPICLDRWPVSPPPTGPDAAFTTVMNWSAGRPLVYDGESWGQKDVEFRRLLDLPSAVREVPLALAVGGGRGHPFPAEEV